MLTNRHQVTIEWGHCDPAGIVYFPNYFTYFDSGTNALFLRALSYNKFEMIRRYGIVGIPLVDVGAAAASLLGARRGAGAQRRRLPRSVHAALVRAGVTRACRPRRMWSCTAIRPTRSSTASRCASSRSSSGVCSARLTRVGIP